MSKEKQIEEMAEELRHSCEGECFRNKDGFIDCEVCEAMLLYNAGYRKQSEPISCGHENGGGWISVSERLPEGHGRFLLIDDEGYMFTASWCGDSGWFMPICHGNAITHWMPLPEPPKGDYDGKK